MLEYMFTECQRDDHHVHLIIYHFVWTPKRRKPVLLDGNAAEIKRLIKHKCKEMDWTILELAVQSDHVHLAM